LVGRAKESLIVALGPSKFEAEFTTGKRMSRDAALRLALGESDPVHVATDRIEAGHWQGESSR